MQDELTSFTLEAVAGAFFGDYATPDFVKDVKRLLPVMTGGVFSLPVRFPWPLSKIPMLSFRKSMKARKAFEGIVRDLLQERRLDLTVAERAAKGKSGGLLDSLFKIQQEQRELDQMQKDGKLFDDHFIIDNVRGLPHRSISALVIFVVDYDLVSTKSYCCA